MYRIAICDDDMAFSSTLEDMIRKILSSYNVTYELHSFPDISSFENAHKKSPFTLLFLDILLEDDNGMDYARNIRTLKDTINIIFISSCIDYAVESYDVMPLYYLTKPLQADRLEKSLLRSLASDQYDLTFESHKNSVLLNSENILYIEVFNHTIQIHEKSGAISSVNGCLSEIEKKLPPLLFLRIHRCYIVNINYIQNIERYNVTLCDNTRLPVARNRYREIQERLIEQIHEKSLFL